MKNGLAEFETQPLRFNWIDNMFGVIEHSTSFLSASATKWADVVQQDLPQALARADAKAKSSNANQSTTPAHVVTAAWRTALGVYQVGSDISRAMLQILGPGIGKADTAIVEGLSDIQRSGGLTEFLEQHDVTDVAAVRNALFEKAPEVQSAAEFDALLARLLQTHGNSSPRPSTAPPSPRRCGTPVSPFFAARRVREGPRPRGRDGGARCGPSAGPARPGLGRPAWMAVGREGREPSQA